MVSEEFIRESDFCSDIVCLLLPYFRGNPETGTSDNDRTNALEFAVRNLRIDERNEISMHRSTRQGFIYSPSKLFKREPEDPHVDIRTKIWEQIELYVANVRGTALRLSAVSDKNTSSPKIWEYVLARLPLSEEEMVAIWTTPLDELYLLTVGPSGIGDKNDEDMWKRSQERFANLDLQSLQDRFDYFYSAGELVAFGMGEG